MLSDRLERWSRRHPLQVGGVSVSRLSVRVVEGFIDVRAMGLAAEMTYYALLSLFPLIGALGASLGFMERLLGPEQALEVEVAIVASLNLVFSHEATTDVIAPLVAGLIREERAGFALGGFLITMFLTSRIFRSAIDTLDAAYRVEERRSFLALWSLGLLFAVCAVLAAVILIAMVVVGPLLGGGRVIADWLRLGAAYEWVWTIARWPVVFLAATGFLSLLYRFGPNARCTWRESLPGAVVGMILLILAAMGFRAYIAATGLQSPVITDADDAVLFALQAFGALMAVLLWIWLSGMVVVTGGVVNAELRRLRRGPPPSPG